MFLVAGLWAVGALMPSRPGWEVEVMRSVAEQRSALATDVMGAITALGGGAGTSIFLLVLGLIAIMRSRGVVWPAFLLLCSVAPALLSNGLKRAVERPRPDLEAVVDVGGFAFPSGHATAAATLAAVLIVFARRARPRLVRLSVWIGAVAFAVLVGLSRIYLGVHWPTDVVGGLVLGAGWVAICALALRPDRRSPDLI